MTRTSDFGGLLRTLAADRRTVRMIAFGQEVEMFVDLVEGRIVRVDATDESDWPLGQLLAHLGLIPSRKVDQLAATARSGKRAPEEIALSRDLISLPLLKRFRERLTLHNLCCLGLMDSFRAELKTLELNDLKAREWDVEIPVPFALESISGRIAAAARWSVDLPDPAARYEQRDEAAVSMLAEQTQKGPTTGSLEWSPEVRRIFFLCNGRTPFRAFPLIVGQAPEQVATYLEEMLDRGLIDHATRSMGRQDLLDRFGGVFRTLNSFGAGLVSMALLVLVLVQLSSWYRGRLAALPPAYEQHCQVQARPTAWREVQGALEIQKLLEDRYPANLNDLSTVSLIRTSLLGRLGQGAPLNYTTDPSGMGYQLFLGE